VVAQRTITNLLDRYDELRALSTVDPKRWEPVWSSCYVSGSLTASAKRTRRVNRALPNSSRLRQDIATIRQELLNRSQKRFSEKP